ncbi:hypothetical protein RRF57_012013 [Xylaria bambusicola]|uniref:Uncharacterized protein n=1 Tax=Xylaria bambusicola TaxID=326684 RepID=A0AAN7V186_9PEZI
MRISALILSAAAVLLQGAWSQRLPVSEPTTDAIAVDESSGTEQVAINRTDANPPSPPEDQEQPVPISAVLFDGPPGPKDCRGNVVLNIGLTKPGAQHSTPTCYNIPGVAQCGNFVGNKDDGCEGASSASRIARSLRTSLSLSPRSGLLGVM